MDLTGIVQAGETRVLDPIGDAISVLVARHPFEDVGRAPNRLVARASRPSP